MSAAGPPQGANSAPRGAAQRPNSSMRPRAWGDHTNGHPVAPRRLWWLAAGFTVWCSALVFLYAIHAIGCTFAWSTGSLRLGLAVVLVAHLIVIGWMWRKLAATSPDPGSGLGGTFLHTVVIWTLMAALVATVLVFGPPLLLTTCI
jgi:hypothetical protein